jgi:hypothetical protein
MKGENHEYMEHHSYRRGRDRDRPGGDNQEETKVDAAGRIQ